VSKNSVARRFATASPAIKTEHGSHGEIDLPRHDDEQHHSGVAPTDCACNAALGERPDGNADE